MTHVRLAPLGEVISLNPANDVTSISNDDEIDFFPMSVIDAASSVATTAETRPYVEVQRGYTCFSDGDVLVAKITPCFENGKIAEARVRSEVAFGSTEFYVLRPHAKGLDTRYLVHFLRREKILVEGERKMTGSAGQRRVPKHFFEALQIPLPRVAEQRRIAAILDKADALRAKRQDAIVFLDGLAQSLFSETFGDLMHADGPWSLVPVSEFVREFESGKSIVAEDIDDLGAEYRVLKVSAVTSLEYKASESKAVPRGYRPPVSHFVRNGDLLFSRANTTELVGATAYVSDTPTNLLLPDKLWRFVWHDSPRAHPRFVDFAFRQKKFRAEVGRRASGSSGSMKNISQEKLLSIEIALPPMETQHLFASRLQKIEAIRRDCLDTLKRAKDFFTSLQHRAFTGTL